MTGKTTLALFSGNRGSFPAPPIRSAREDIVQAQHELGYETLLLEESVRMSRTRQQN
jgi:hypothetical protein